MLALAVRKSAVPSIVRAFAKSVRVRELRRKQRNVSRFATAEIDEKPLSPWLTPERSKVILQELQRLRNMHRLSIKYDPKLVKEYIRLSEIYSRFRLHEFLKIRELLTLDQSAQLQAKAHLQTLPVHLQKPGKSEPMPVEINGLRHVSQMSMFLPKILSNNMRAAEALLEVIEDRKSTS
jgi:hypothetical protein